MDIKDFKIKDFKPLWDNIIIKPIKIESRGDFVRIQGEEDKAELGEVVLSNIDEIKKGDIVMFNKYSSISLDIGDEILVKSEDIIAIKNGK